MIAKTEIMIYKLECKQCPNLRPEHLRVRCLNSASQKRDIMPRCKIKIVIVKLKIVSLNKLIQSRATQTHTCLMSKTNYHNLVFASLQGHQAQFDVPCNS